MPDQQQDSYIVRANLIINGSHLTPADKKLLIGRMPFVGDSMLQMFVAVCEEDPFGIDAIVKSLKKKLDTQGNLVKLHEIVSQERKEIEDLISASN